MSWGCGLSLVAAGRKVILFISKLLLLQMWCCYDILQDEEGNSHANSKHSCFDLYSVGFFFLLTKYSV